MIPHSLLQKTNQNSKFRWLHYCMIMYGGKVITTGHNKNSGFTYNYNEYSCHAECVAIMSLPKKYWNGKAKLDMIVIRHDLGNSKPCEQCIRFIKKVPVNINKISYTITGGLVTEKVKDISSNHTSLYNSPDIPKKKRQQHIYTKCNCGQKYKYKCKHTKTINLN